MIIAGLIAKVEGPHFANHLPRTKTRNLENFNSQLVFSKSKRSTE